MKYGTGRQSFNICAFCGRGGARTMGPHGRAHLKCVPSDDKKSYSTPSSIGGPWCEKCGGVGWIKHLVKCPACRGTGRPNVDLSGAGSASASKAGYAEQ